MVDLPSLAAAVLSGSHGEANSARDRMLDAARTEFVNHGIARTSVATIAARAGVSRPTLYRQCGDKDQIVAAVTQREVLDFFTRGVAALASQKTAEDKMVEIFVMGMRECREHPLVRALRDFENEAFTSRLFKLDEPDYRSMLGMLAMFLADGDYPPAAIERALDFSLRVTATILIAPSELLPTDNDENTREFARRYLIPVLQASR
ncbi:TetR/AcrR family transcriptional regulator [Mycolicibacterium mucogenicum]|uniref:TetR/AcrR family transcriptional regulator n=1 Tax=Mycolicibacterium mucogenicum DSM 44124 TaxID=1226753 RepID=A0A8H2PJA9_MYCMU|nr:TetR/AcrR family transcriptional regulator [Mycolicibacterium mucogenicum]KAB7752763.1 TetR family transcriptional regulator [Mycolicibacterium mucogenicum DSM 44124]QPG69069.1 TetR/AcrR family transcriptional regulator [Mycolicibacterium mucogenicum DSM 44124]